jgi:hypothetical protein
MRQRPFFIAGFRQGTPFLVFAPHRAQLWKSPGEFPFFSQPRRSGAAPLLFDGCGDSASRPSSALVI